MCCWDNREGLIREIEGMVVWKTWGSAIRLGKDNRRRRVGQWAFDLL